MTNPADERVGPAGGEEISMPLDAAQAKQFCTMHI